MFNEFTQTNPLTYLPLTKFNMKKKNLSTYSGQAGLVLSLPGCQHLSPVPLPRTPAEGVVGEAPVPDLGGHGPE